MRRVALGVAIGIGSACADSAGECPMAECDSTAEVAYNDFSLPGPYDLTIDLGGEQVLVRCNDSGSPEADENPEDVTCHASGFSIVGPRADRTSVRVTLYEIETDSVVVQNALVQLAVPPDGEIRPAGPDCPPVCYERYGSVVTGGP